MLNSKLLEPQLVVGQPSADDLVIMASQTVAPRNRTNVLVRAAPALVGRQYFCPLSGSVHPAPMQGCSERTAVDIIIESSELCSEEISSEEISSLNCAIRD
jgi:hypothetical protein